MATEGVVHRPSVPSCRRTSRNSVSANLLIQPHMRKFHRGYAASHPKGGLFEEGCASHSIELQALHSQVDQGPESLTFVLENVLTHILEL